MNKLIEQKQQKMMHSLPISRRVFSKLSMSGFLLTAAPLQRLYAQSGQSGKAKRFLAFVVPGGVWHPTFLGGDANGLRFNSAVKALEPFADQIVGFKGLRNYAGTGKDTHQRGYASILTGFYAGADWKNRSTVRSVDQIIADQLGKDSFYKSLTAGMLDCGDRNEATSRMVFSASKTAVTPIDTAPALFDRVFAGVDLSGRQAPAVDPLSGRRMGALDAVKEQIALMEKELVGDDKIQMQQHLEAVQEIEKRMQGPGGTSNASYCAPPSRRSGNLDPYAETDLIADMTAQALICGLTNVATIQVNKEGSTLNYEFLKEWTDVHGSAGKRHHDATHADNFNQDAVKAKYSAVDKFWMDRLARIVKLLDSVPEDGGTMLDNTVIFAGSSLQSPRGHSHSDLRWMLIGGKGLNLWKTNRMVDARGENAHNLLISMMQTCGLPNTTLGNDPDTRGYQPLSVL